MKRVAFLLFVPWVLWADKVPYVEPKYEPWLTGPLLAPTAQVVPVGHLNFEPYIYDIATTGAYNRDWDAVPTGTIWVNSLQLYTQVGLTDWMDIEIFPTFSYDYSHHQAKWVFNDFPVGIDIQLFHSPDGCWIPHFKLTLRESFPTGKFDRLDPKKLLTDSGGAGSFITSFQLTIGKLIQLYKVHFMTVRLALDYNLPAPVQLKGFNTYGGAKDTDARFFPAQNFITDLGIEIMLSQNWALAFDLYGVWGGKSHFSGNPGTLPDGTPASLGTGSSVQYSIAPAFEYNWSADIGIIAGSWFTIGGRNSPQFQSFVAAFNYYH